MSNLITRMCLLHKLFNNMCFVFPAWAFDDVMIFEYLKIKNYLKNEKSFRSEIKNIFPCFTSAILDIQNKLAKM